MTELLKQLDLWLQCTEGENFEFKEAKNKFNFEELCQYVCGIANAGGGKILFGVSDKRPRRVVGTKAFSQPERTLAGILSKIPLRVSVDPPIEHPNGEVVVFHIPSRPAGMPVKYEGVYWMRRGDSLVALDERELRDIFAEIEDDLSAKVCPEAKISDLDIRSVELFRKLWIKKSGNQSLQNLSVEQLLTDAEVMSNDGITYAALIAFGTHQALGRLLANAEVIFEYRSKQASGPASERKEFRRGLFSFYEELWELINKRNEKQHYQEGFFIYDIPTFDERPIREAILNAVSHRDYRMSGSIFIRQYPQRIEITNPGGLLPQVTFENILDRQCPRNRRLSELLLRCGLVERSGQGINLIFESAIRNSKPEPDFSLSDKFQFGLSLDGTIQDPNFIKFLQKIGQEQSEKFTTQDWLILGAVATDKKISDNLKPSVQNLVELGILEKKGRGKLLLSRKYYSFVGRKGTYTRKRGLDREHNKALLFKHIAENKKEGSPLRELSDVLPNLTTNQLQSLVKELKTEKKIYSEGTTRAAKWYPCITSEN
jgi:ATP-dependent DNA helicase RecG